jgi:hypothetical protein
MYFFRAPNGKMLAIAGLRTTTGTLTERKKGAIAVREILADHTLGPVFTLRPPANPAESKPPPDYQRATDAAFVEACKQLLTTKPFLEQADYGYFLDDGARMKWHDINAWPADEPSRDHFDRFGKAMSFYHRKDGALVAVMKWGWVLVSRDEGESWSSPTRPPTFVSGMAKAWGQRTGDGRYALLYDPSLDQRWPLVIVHGDDGIHFRDMRAVHADLPPLRYPGRYKSPGPQYVRGISEWSSDGSFKDAANAVWVCYSVNKEDIWVSRVPLPLNDKTETDTWNTYSPKWAPATVTTTAGVETIQLADRDPADYARATRVLAKPASSLDISVDIRVERGATEPLLIDLIGPRAASAATITIKPIYLAPGQWQTLAIKVDCPSGKVTSQFADRPATTRGFAQSVAAITRITFRTGDRVAPASPDDDRPTAVSQYQVKDLR